MDAAILGACATVSVACAMIRERTQRRRRRALRRTLAAQDSERPLSIDHLSPALARIAWATRLVRLELETPLLRLAGAQPRLHELPWRRRERLRDYDVALVDARRALWDWLGLLAALGTGDKLRLGALGLDPRPLRSLVFAPGVLERTDHPFDDALFPVAPDTDGVIAALGQALQDLRRFELVLSSPHEDPYR
jgi:hypothetical protein